MNSITELSDQNYKSELESKEIAIVDIYASWCGSCRLFAPTFEKTSNEYPQFSFYKIDGEKNPTFSESLEIDNLPFVAVFHNGDYVGGQSTTKQDVLIQMIQTIQERVK